MADSVDSDRSLTATARALHPLPRRAASRLAACVLGVMAMSTSACAHHLRLASPDTDPGARYVCSVDGTCRPDDNDVPAEDNPSNTTQLTLPRECGGKYHQILIVDAGSSKPTLRVTCAPAEEPVGTMGDPEAQNAPPTIEDR